MADTAETPTDAFRVATPSPSGLDGATVELPPRRRAGGAGRRPVLVGVQLVQHPPAPPRASALSSRQWRRVRRGVGVGVFVLLTALGVDVGLHGTPASAVASAEGPVAAAPSLPPAAAASPARFPAPPRLAASPARPPRPGHATPAHRRPEHARALGPGGPTRPR